LVARERTAPLPHYDSFIEDQFSVCGSRFPVSSCQIFLEAWAIVRKKGGIQDFVGLFAARTAGFLGVALGLILLAGLAGCRGSATLGEGTLVLALTSSSLQRGVIPKQYTCDGGEASPELAWTAPPAATQSFALTVFDRDSPLNFSFVHWVLYDLPAEKRELPEGLPKQAQLADGSRQGQNDDDKIGYVGPCPPGKSAHRYVFALYAVDSRLNLPAGATRRQVEKALQGHILAHGELVGQYQH
jgi:Raf kinase inhibitor-like YbhB/YbcL family protein